MVVNGKAGPVEPAFCLLLRRPRQGSVLVMVMSPLITGMPENVGRWARAVGRRGVRRTARRSCRGPREFRNHRVDYERLNRRADRRVRHSHADHRGRGCRQGRPDDAKTGDVARVHGVRIAINKRHLSVAGGAGARSAGPRAEVVFPIGQVRHVSAGRIPAGGRERGGWPKAKDRCDYGQRCETTTYAHNVLLMHLIDTPAGIRRSNIPSTHGLRTKP